jgi:hypothetical protein
MGLSPLLDGVLDTCDEEGRRNPEITRPLAACSCTTSRKAAMQYDVARTGRREYYA